MIADVAAQTEHVTRDTVVPPNSLRRNVCIRADGPTVLPISMELMVSAKAVLQLRQRSGWHAALWAGLSLISVSVYAQAIAAAIRFPFPAADPRRGVAA